MGRQHVKKGRLVVRQSKTGTVVSIPILAPLRAALDASKTGQMTFLTAPHGAPFSPGAFSNWFGKAVRAAGLPLGFSAHGLRKAMCRRMAEAGCTVYEIQAISGHISLKEVEHYTKGVDQERLANAAMVRICKSLGPNLQTDIQAVENTEDEITDVSPFRNVSDLFKILSSPAPNH
jgi:integrase